MHKWIRFHTTWVSLAETHQVMEGTPSLAHMGKLGSPVKTQLQCKECFDLLN